MKIRFLQWTDSHGYAVGSNYTNSCIGGIPDLDFAIHTGDVCRSSFSDDSSYAQLSNSLFVVGNHDVVNSSGIGSLPSGYDDWADQPSPSNIYTKFFQPNVAKWGVTMNEGETWWKKRFPEKNLCIVGLDSTTRGQQLVKQRAFLDKVLKECTDNNDKVIFASHFVEHGIMPVPCCFTFLHYYMHGGQWSDYSGWYPFINECMETVTNYVNNTGLKVIAWVCGHEHADAFFTHRPFPVIVCGSTIIDSWNNLSRSEGNALTSRACMNLYEYDDELDTLRIYRLGADNATGGARRKMLVYDVGQRRIVSACSR